MGVAAQWMLSACRRMALKTGNPGWKTVVSRALLFSLAWWILADGAASSWWIGAPAALLTVITSLALIPAAPFSWFELARFVPFFLYRSLLGGADVARRAFHPRMPIDPDLVEYPLRLPPGLARVFMVNTINLLPGTLCAEIDSKRLRVHVLDARNNFQSEIEAVETGVARMFGVAINDTSDGGDEK